MVIPSKQTMTSATKLDIQMADWAGDLNTRHSPSGYVVKIGNSLVS